MYELEQGCVLTRDWAMAMSLMQAPQRERGRQSVRTGQYCCSSQRPSLLKLCDSNPNVSDHMQALIAKSARESSMQAR